MIHEPAVLCTLLGSCVGITFWVERLRVGALCHPMLPAMPQRRALHDGESTPRRYVDFTILDIASQFDALGISRQETEVKVFGGADVIDFDRSHARPTIGWLNRDAAERILRTEGYKVVASSLGGHSGVQIHFNTTNGEVLLRRFGRARKPDRLHRQRAPKAEEQPCK